MAFCQTRHHDSGFCGAIWLIAELQKWQFLFSISLLSDQSMTCSLLTSHFQTGTSAHQVLKSNSYYHVIENRKSRAEKVRVEKRHIFCENGHLVGRTPDLRSTIKRWLQDAGWLEICNTTVKGKHWNRKTSTGSLWKIVKKKKVCFSRFLKENSPNLWHRCVVLSHPQKTREWQTGWKQNQQYSHK